MRRHYDSINTVIITYKWWGFSFVGKEPGSDQDAATAITYVTAVH